MGRSKGEGECAGDGAGHGGSGGGTAARLIDPDAIARLRQLDPTGQQGVLVRVLQAYESSLERQLSEVAHALEQSDPDRMARAAHTLKSSSAAVGAMTFSSRCADIEHTVRQQRVMPDTAAVEALIHEGSQVLRAVGDMLLGQSGTPT